MRWVTRVSAVVPALLGAVGCSGPAALEPHVRLADAIADAREWRDPPAATIAGRTHYVMNDVGPRALVPPGRPPSSSILTADSAGRLALEGHCPPEWAGRHVLIDAAVLGVPTAGDDDARAGALSITRHSEVVACPSGDGRIEVVVPGLEADRAHARGEMTGMVLPPSVTVSPWIDVPREAVLRVALGVRRGGDVGVDAMHFRVRAECPDGRTVDVAEWTVSASGDHEQGQWREVGAPLAAVRRRLGERIRLVFETTPWHGASGVVLPFWGDPTVYAPPARGDAARRRRHVVLVSFDTLRADRLGVYGYPLAITPNLDRFAATGAVIERAIAPANWTIPSHASMLTGLQPCAHGFSKAFGTLARSHFDPAVVTLAETLRRQGYQTAAFTENAYVGPLPFQRGFDRFDADTSLDGVGTTGLIDATFGKALAWASRVHAEGPFFLFAHTYQVHAPYTPEPEDLAAIPSPLPLPPGGVPPAPRGEANARAYVAEIAYMDRAFGRFLDGLDALGIADDSIVVVTSDHGEAFGEHGVHHHGGNLHEEQLWVPLLWRAPRLVEPGRRVRGLASLADIPPTILALLGEPVPAWLQGLSLAPFLAPGDDATIAPARTLPIEGMSGRGMRAEGWKLLQVTPYASRARRLVVFARDPTELEPVVAGRSFVEDLDRQLERECEQARQRLAAAAPSPAVAPAPPPLDVEREHKLRALGYVE